MLCSSNRSLRAAKVSEPPVSSPDTDVRRAAPVVHHVLVVDDDLSFGQAVSESLEDRDIRATAVASPHEALALAARTDYAVAIIDLIMPEMNGLDLARELHLVSPSTEVVMLTGHADVRSAIEAIRVELFDYLQKESIDVVRLVRTVRAAVARGQLKRENQRLLTSLTATARRLRTLAERSAALSAERHPDSLFETLILAARDLLEAERVRVLLVDRSDFGDVTIREAFGDGDIAPGAHFGAGEGIVACVVETGAAVRAETSHDHQSYSPRSDDLGASLPGLVCVPLTGPGIHGVLVVAGRSRPFDEEDVALLDSLARLGAAALANAQSAESSQNFATHISEILVTLLDAQDVHYHGHSRAVAALTDMLTRRLGVPEEERRTLHFAALMHDVGKLRLPPDLLSWDGALTPEGVLQLREHPRLGVEMILPISRWASLAPAILSHHERWDGRGYPRGLAGSDIPLGGRIVAIAEAFEAMTRATPARAGRSLESALAEVERCAGSAFDPDLARLFVEEYRANQEQLEGP